MERRRKKLSARQLGEKLGVTGQLISYYESGQGNISVTRLEEIADALELPISTFFKSEVWDGEE